MTNWVHSWTLMTNDSFDSWRVKLNHSIGACTSFNLCRVVHCLNEDPLQPTSGQERTEPRKPAPILLDGACAFQLHCSCSTHQSETVIITHTTLSLKLSKSNSSCSQL